jgi:hypothetical protein
MMKSFRLQYASNLFVDKHKIAFDKLVRPNANFLALCGNIGALRHGRTPQFLRYCTQNWDQIFWILAPHELSNLPKHQPEQVQELAYLAQQYADDLDDCNSAGNGKIHIMNTKDYYFKNLNTVLVGATLWGTSQSTVPTPYAGMYYKDKPIHQQTLTQWSKEDRDYLYMRRRFWMNTEPEANIVYLTHHLPSAALINRSIKESATYSLEQDVNLEAKQLMASHLTAWLAGASGSCSSGYIKHKANDVYCATNGAFAYSCIFDKVQAGYRPDMVMELKVKSSSNTINHESILYLPPMGCNLFRRGNHSHPNPVLA